MAKWFYVTDVVVKQNRVLVKGCMTPLEKRKEREKKKRLSSKSRLFLYNETKSSGLLFDKLRWGELNDEHHASIVKHAYYSSFYRIRLWGNCALSEVCSVDRSTHSLFLREQLLFFLFCRSNCCSCFTHSFVPTETQRELPCWVKHSHTVAEEPFFWETAKKKKNRKSRSFSQR